MFQPLMLMAGLGLAQTAFSMPTTPNSQRDTASIQKRAVTNLPTNLITCPDTREGKDPSTDTISFNDFQVEDATQRGLQSEPGTSDPNPGGFSHEFRNDEAFVFAGCENAAFFEYPLLESAVYGGGEPGPFRVIFTPDPDFASRNGKFCGIVVHPRNADGTPSGRFDLCS